MTTQERREYLINVLAKAMHAQQYPEYARDWPKVGVYLTYYDMARVGMDALLPELKSLDLTDL